jgi:hypothetical protein
MLYACAARLVTVVFHEKFLDLNKALDLRPFKNQKIFHEPKAHFEKLLSFGFQELFAFCKVLKLRSKSSQ